MNLKKKPQQVFLVSMILILISFSFIASANNQAAPNQYFFDVRILAKSSTPTSNMANLLSQELNRIRIDSQVITHPEGVFESELISRTFDLVFLELEWPTNDVNPSVYFSENGSGNYWGITEDISGGSLNEELLLNGTRTVNPVERQLIYNEWQDNLMNNILPIIPLYNKIASFASWDVLSGWDHEEGIVASLPFMEWTEKHHQDQNTSIFVDYIDTWYDLNPLYTEEEFVLSLIAEPLFRIDSNNLPVGVLAETWEFNTNKTILTIDLRKDVKWQPDQDDIYFNEYFDADDVLFSIFMYQEVATIGSFYNWIESVEKYNSSRVIITIDSNKQSPGLQPYAPAMYELNKMILPEHYLNVSLNENSIPDTSHINWQNYGQFGLGTGMYVFVPERFNDDIEAVLYAYNDWWGASPAGLNEDLDFKQYTLRFLFDQTTRQLEFEGGDLDLFRDYRETYTQYKNSPYQLQTRTEFDVTYIGFNLLSQFAPEINDEALTEDTTMSKGLAVRKAIAHLIDKSIFDALLDIEIQIIDSPLSNKFSSFVYEDITKYDYDIEMAKEFMRKAGYDPETIATPAIGFGLTISTIFVLAVITIIFRSKK